MNNKEFETEIQRLERSGFPIDKKFAKAIRKMKQEFSDLAKELSLCVDEFGEAQSTHYYSPTDKTIRPKGSFIALCEKARKLHEKLG